MTTSLKRCPFCGSQPVLEGDGSILWVVCPDDSACRESGMAMGIRRDDMEHGIASWNRRATSPTWESAVKQAKDDALFVFKDSCTHTLDAIHFMESVMCTLHPETNTAPRGAVPCGPDIVQ